MTNHYTLRVLLVSVRTKLHQIGSFFFLFCLISLKIKLTTKEMSVLFEPNQTPIVRLSLIGFLFDFCLIRYPGVHVYVATCTQTADKRILYMIQRGWVGGLLPYIGIGCEEGNGF